MRVKILLLLCLTIVSKAQRYFTIVVYRSFLYQLSNIRFVVYHRTHNFKTMTAAPKKTGFAIHI